jgi:hypothetical protein
MLFPQCATCPARQAVFQYWHQRLKTQGLATVPLTERHGGAWHRVKSLDVYPDLAEKGRAWAVWDEYPFEHDDEGPDLNPRLDTIPHEIRAIGEKRRLGVALTPAERKKLQRFREGRYTGQRGRPKKCHANRPDNEEEQMR